MDDQSGATDAGGDTGVSFRRGEIVVVDDEPGTLKLLNSLLAEEGYVVRGFTSGDVALRSIEAEPPDLVMLDIRMPGLSGLDVCEKLKSDPNTASIPVVFLSAATDVDDKVMAFRAGGVDYLTKPFHRQELVARVRTHVSLFRGAKEIARISEELRRSERRYRLAFQSSPLGMAVVNGDGLLLEVNQTLANMVGKPADAMVGRDSIASLSAPDEVPSNLAVRDRMVSGAQPTAGFDTTMVAVNGRRIPVRVDASRVDTEDAPLLFAFITDLSEIHEKSRQLAYLAERDPLTGVLNRRGFLDQVQTALDEALSDGRPCGVLFIDIDGFKIVNDVYGHRVGDRLLCAVADRLVKSTEAHRGQVGRLGGDEFAVLLPACSTSDVPGIAREVERSIGESLIVDGVRLEMSCSIGQAVSAGSALDCEDLLARADQAMYAARRARAGNLARKLEELTHALEAGQLLMYFQSIWALGPCRPTLYGHEALVRWRHPEQGLVLPGEFIRAAEEGGLIHRLDLWAAAEAMRRLARRPELSVAINCSALTLAVPGVAQELLRVIRAVDRDPTSVVVELTESVDIPDNSQIMHSLNELRSEGIRIALDDFGSGYAGLNNLRTLPIDVVKIDRSLIDTLAEESDEAVNTEHFLAGIRDLTRAMGTQLLAEGIETTRQLDLVQKLGFDYAQGFLLAYPGEGEGSDDDLPSGGSGSGLP